MSDEEDRRLDAHALGRMRAIAPVTEIDVADLADDGVLASRLFAALIDRMQS